MLSPEARLLHSCRGKPVDRPPVWLMRQAGRYLPAYRAVREGVTFLEMCRDVDRAVEVSLQPLDWVGTEAVILFSDIFVPVVGMGVALDFAPGPVVAEPIRTASQVRELSTRDPRETVPYVFEILRRLRGELGPPGIPLLGFAGAPLTLACYLVRGAGDPEHRFAEALTLADREPEVFDALLEKLTLTTIAYLEAQIEAGAQVLQLFDTWAGVFDAARYRDRIAPLLRRIAAAVTPQVPLILFGGEASHLHEILADCGADVVSVGSGADLGAVARRIGGRVSLQGNLPPEALKRPREEIFRRVRALAEAARPARGHILNLGHGCTPDTPVEGVRAFTDAARALETR